jgi:hypothetical protein
MSRRCAPSFNVRQARASKADIECMGRTTALAIIIGSFVGLPIAAVNGKPFSPPFGN